MVGELLAPMLRLEAVRVDVYEHSNAVISS